MTEATIVLELANTQDAEQTMQDLAALEKHRTRVRLSYVVQPRR